MSLLKERVMIEGLMPERALLRLRRANIDVYDLKKPQKNQILFTVKKKDIEKVFAIYPDVCYNVSVYTPYKAKRMGAVGWSRIYEKGKNRMGLLLGGLLFLCMLTYADRFIFKIEFVGANVYEREAIIALEQGGIKAFSPYRTDKTDWITSQMLSLEGVEYCSVKKSGFKAVVEIRLSPFEKPVLLSGDMLCEKEGKILSITALHGTALKKVGEEVKKGEVLVGGWFLKEDGSKVSVEPIARASIACVFETDIQADTEEEAFAAAYLALQLKESDKITEKEIVKKEELFHVKISYVAIEQINM